MVTQAAHSHSNLSSTHSQAVPFKSTQYILPIKIGVNNCLRAYFGVQLYYTDA